jgi:LuxR family transcriptional regulator of spore coat protein
LTNQKGKPLLTNREREVFELLVQDKTTKEIAQQLFISEKTVRNHISNVLRTICGKRNKPQAGEVGVKNT